MSPDESPKGKDPRPQQSTHLVDLPGVKMRGRHFGFFAALK
jgi:hypothetical protein